MAISRNKLTRDKKRQKELRAAMLARRSRRSLLEQLEQRQMMAAEVTNFRLWYDSGYSSTDKVSSDTRLAGALAFGSGNSGRVDFDHNGDGTADGTVSVVNSGGNFKYEPRDNGLAESFTGSLDLKYRAVELDSYGGVLDTGSWNSFPITVESRLGADLQNLHLVNDTGSSSTDKVTTDLRLAGAVTWDGYGGFAQVEFDLHNDGAADGYAGLWWSGESFEVNLRNMGLSSSYSGALPLKYRIVEFDSYSSPLYTSDWQSFAITVETPRLYGNVNSLQLVSDTGSSSTDKVTSDPRVSGSISWDGYGGSVQVEFDHNNDGSYDGYAGTYYSGGSFTYDPRNWGLSSIYSGELPLRYRIVERDDYYNTLFTGSWQDFTITLEPQRINAVMSGLALVSDTGTSSTDKITTDPRLTGNVSWDGYGGYVDIQFDHNNDNYFDGYAGVWSSGSSFNYDPRSWGLSSEHAGVVPMRYRFVEYNENYTAIYTSSWTSFEYTMLAPRLDATLNGLALVSDTGTSSTDKITSDPRVTGSVSWDGYGGWVDVQFDHNSDGSYDGYAGIWSSGSSFTYDPRSWGISSNYSGELPLKYRTVEYSSSGSTLFTSDWTTFSITIEQPRLNATLTGPQLVVDDGASSSDRVTTDPRVSGSVTWDGYGGSVQVEFDHNADGSLDGYAGIWSSGSSFTYDPRSFGLSSSYSGSLPLKYRVVEMDSYGGTLHTSNWQDFAITISGAEPSATLSNLHLVSDTGTSSTDKITSDPRLAGNVNWDGYGGYVSVEFDHTGNGSVDGSTTLYMSGDAFQYDPRSSDTSISTYAGTLPLKYRLVENTSGGSTIVGSWQSFTYTLVGESPAPEITVVDSSIAPIADEIGSYSFGTTVAGSSIVRTFTIVNQGTGTLTLDSNSLTLPSGFALVSTFDSTVDPDGGTTTFSVRLEAASPGVYSGTLSFDSNDADESPYNFTITGHVLSAEAEIDVKRADGSGLADGTGTLSFGATATGTAVSRTITISNIGYSTLVLDDQSLSLPSGYSLVSGFSTSVSPGESTYLTVQLDATSAGTYGGQLSFTTNDTSEGIFNFQLTGTVEAPTPEIVVRLASESNRSLYSGSDSVDFSWAQVGGANARTLLIENTGTGTLTLDSASLILPVGFRVATPFAATVAPGASTSLIIEFAPGSAGFHSGELSFANNDSDEGLFRFTLLGEGYGSGTPSGTQLIVGLRNDTGVSSSDKVTSDYHVVGEVTGLATGESARIAIDLGTDGIAETEITVTAASPEFAFDPTTIASSFAATLGAKLLRFKVTYLDDQDNEIGTGNWQTFSYALEDIRTNVSASLLNDTGPVHNDRVTYDPTLSLYVILQSGSGNVRVELDHNEDGIADGSQSVQYSSEIIHYNPVTIDSSYANLRGELDLRYRSVIVGSQGEVIAYGSWNSFVFEQTGDTRADGFWISEFGLSSDNGVSGSDRITTIPDIYLVGGGEFGEGNGAVDFDFNGDGLAESSVAVAEVGEEYAFDPRDIDEIGFSSPGEKVIWYRARKQDGQGLTVAAGAWQPFRFSIASPPTSYASVQNVALVSDTGANSYDRITSKAAIKGNVQSGESYGGNLAFVEVDWDANGTTDEVVQAVQGLSGLGFTATPGTLAYGSHDVLLRVREWSSEYGMYRYSSWSTFDFQLVAASAPTIASIQLEGDASSASGYATSSETTLEGQVTLPVDQAFVIYLDADGDDIADATSYSDWQGKFTIDTPVAAAGQVSIRLRTAYYDSALQGEVLGPWKTFSYEYTSPALPDVTELSLQNDDGTSTTDGITKDPTVKGKVTAPSTSSSTSVSGVMVEFDEDGDGEAEGISSTSSVGEFSYRPLTLLPGSVTVRARSRAYDPVLRTNVYGEWKSLSFTLEAIAFSAGTLSVSLAKPSTSNPSVTTDPAIKGTATVGNGRHAVIEFDHNGDGVAEGSIATDTSNQFTYVPVGIGVGTHTIRSRIREWNPIARQVVVGDWVEMTYTVSSTTNQSPTVTQLSLASDSGTSPSDFITSNTILQGTVNNPDGSETGLPVEIDVDNDGVGDTIVFADSNGKFAYEVQAIPYGVNTVNVRAIEWDGVAGQYLISSWSTLSFTYTAPTGEAAYVAELTTVTPAYSGQVINPVLTGSVINDGKLKDIVVEFDYNGDDIIDARTITSDLGRYEYRPVGLTAGNQTIRARARELDTITGQLTTSGWTSLWFTNVVSTNQIATVSSLQLVEDTGSQGDGKSANSSIKGFVSNDGDYSGVVIQIDHNGDGTPDGVAGVGMSGQFTHTPQNLSHGQYTLRVRTKELDELGNAMHGDWQSITFEFRAEPYEGVKIQSLTLADDTGNSSTDKVTANPNLQGTISAASTPITIRFDHNGDSVTDGTVTTDSLGNFSYSPSNLSEGLVTIRASIDGVDVYNGLSWTTITFVYDSQPDSTEAQGIAQTHLTFTAAWQKASDDYNAAVSAANSLYASIRDRATSTYDATVSSSSLAREAALAQAQQAYSIATEAAEEAYASQMASVQSQFMLDLAAYGGNTTTFELRQFAWPATPTTFGLSIPSDSSQPTAPQKTSEVAAYYDWSSDSTYQGEIAAANNTYYSKKVTSDNVYASEKADAEKDYSDALKLANDTHAKDVAAAKKTYEDGLKGPIVLPNDESDPNAGNEELVDLVAAAATYSSEMARATARRDRENLRISNALSLQQQEHMQWLTDESVLMQNWSPESRAARERQNARESTIWLATANETYKKAMAASDLRFGTDVENIGVEYKEQQLLAEGQKTRFEIRLAMIRDKAINAADAKRDKAIASAELAKTKDLAAAAHKYDLNVEKARLDNVLEQSSARTAPLSAWADGLETRWTTYYKELVDHDVSQVSALTPEAKTRFEQDLDTSKSEIEKYADEKKVLTDHRIDLTLAKKDSEATADGKFKAAQAANSTAQKVENEYAFSTFKKADLSITSVHTSQNATNEKNFLVSDAHLWFAVAHDAPVYTYVNSYTYTLNQSRLDSFYTYYTGSGGEGGYFRLLYSHDQESDRIDRERLIARNNAWHVYQSEVYLNAYNRAVDDAIDEEIRATAKAVAAHAFTIAYAPKYIEYINKTSEASATAAVAESATAKEYITKVDESSVERGDQEAETTNSYRTGLAEDHKNAVDTWGTAQGTAWGTLQKELASADYGQISSLGNSLVSNTSSIGQLALTYAGELATEDKEFYDTVVNADDTETQANGDAILEYATSVANHRKAYAIELAAKSRQHDTEVAELDREYRIAASDSQRVFENTVASLRYHATTSYPEHPRSVSHGSLVKNDFRNGTFNYYNSYDHPLVGYTNRYGAAELAYILDLAQLQRSMLASGSDVSTSNPSYVSQKDAMGDTWQAAMRLQQEGYEKAKFEAERTRAEADIAAHRTWVLGVNGKHVTFATQAKDLGGTLADQLAAATIAISTDQADAAQQFAEDVAEADKSYTDSVAGADVSFSEQALTPDQANELSSTTADNSYQEAIVGARGNYENTLHQQHLTKLQQATVPAGAISQLRSYQASSAQADLTWSQQQWDARSAQQSAASSRNLSAIQGGVSYASSFASPTGTSVVGAHSASATQSSSQNTSYLTHVTGSSSALKNLNDDTAQSIRDTVVGVRTAEANDASRQVKAEKTYDVGRAQAALSFHTSSEDALQEWANSVLDARETYWNDYKSEYYFDTQETDEYDAWHDAYAGNMSRAEVRDAAIEEADDEYNADIKEARKAFALAVGDSQITRAQNVTQSAATREDEAGQSVIDGQSGLNAADASYISTSNDLDNAGASGYGLADKIYDEATAKINEFLTEQNGNSNVAYATAVADAHTERAISHANADADFQIALATSAAVRQNAHYQSMATANPSDPLLTYQHFLALQSTAYASWLSGMKPALASYVEAMSDAATAESLAQVEAQTAFDRARAQSQREHAFAQADRRMNERIAETAAYGDHRTLEAVSRHARDLELPEHERALQVAYQEQDEVQLVAQTTAERDFWHDTVGDDEYSYYTYSAAATSALTAARAAANTGWAQAYSTADLNWTTGVTTANVTYDIAIENETFTYNIGVENRDKISSIAQLHDEHARIVANSVAEKTFDLAHNTAANNRRTAEFLASANFQGADYQIQANVITVMASAMNLPWLNFEADLAGVKLTWWANTGRDIWLDVGDDLNTADATYAIAAADLRDDHRTTVADANRDLAISDANRRYTRTAADLAADRDYAIAEVNTNQDYQLELAQTRNYYRNASAAVAEQYAEQTANSQYFFISQTAEYGAVSQQKSARSQAANDRWLVGITAGEGVQLQARATALHNYATSWRTDNVAFQTSILSSAYSRDVALSDLKYENELVRATIQIQSAIDSSVAYAAFTSSSYESTISPWTSREVALSSAVAEFNELYGQNHLAFEEERFQILQEALVEELYAKFQRDLETEVSRIKESSDGTSEAASRDAKHGTELVRWSESEDSSLRTFNAAAETTPANGGEAPSRQGRPGPATKAERSTEAKPSESKKTTIPEPLSQHHSPSGENQAASHAAQKTAATGSASELTGRPNADGSVLNPQSRTNAAKDSLGSPNQNYKPKDPAQEFQDKKSQSSIGVTFTSKAREYAESVGRMIVDYYKGLWEGFRDGVVGTAELAQDIWSIGWSAGEGFASFLEYVAFKEPLVGARLRNFYIEHGIEDPIAEQDEAVNEFIKSTSDTLNYIAKNRDEIIAAVMTKSKEIVDGLLELASTLESFLKRHGENIVEAIINSDYQYIWSAVRELPEEIQNAAITAFGVMGELVQSVSSAASNLITPKTIGWLSGQVLYELAEGAVMSAITAGVTAATGGSGSAVGPALALAKAAKLAKVFKYAIKTLGFSEDVICIIARNLDTATNGVVSGLSGFFKHSGDVPNSKFFRELLEAGCFVGGTLVHVAAMPRDVRDDFFASLTDWNGQFDESTTCLDQVAVQTETLVAIESVPIGARISTKNPRSDEFDDTLPEPDDSWLLVSMVVDHGNGSCLEAEILRPQEWVEFHQLFPGKSFRFHSEDLEVTGAAIITAIQPAPAIAEGEGHMVISRFVTHGVNSLATVTLENGEQLTGTRQHPIWCENREAWVPLAELQPGDLTRSRLGLLQVSQVTLLHDTQTVYNLEVHGEHVYELLDCGILVHNSGEKCFDATRKLAANVAPNSAAARGLKKATEHIDEVADSITARRRAAELAGLGEDSIEFVTDMGPQKGWVVGRQSRDGLRGWRLDWDPEKGYHVNWWDKTLGIKRKDWLYGALKIDGGTWHDYIELLRHGFGN